MQGTGLLGAWDVTLLTLAVSSFLLGLVSCAFHWVKRASHPATADIEAKQRTQGLEIAELTDRLEHFMRRERVRASRDRSASAQDAPESPAETPAPAVGAGLGVDPKNELRRAARARGVLR